MNYQYDGDDSMTQQPINRQEHSQHSKQGAAQYTCPMHPEVVSDQPGDCPKCGMHLVLVESSDSQAHSNHGNCHDHDGHKTNHETTAQVRGGKYDKVPAGHAGAVYTCPMHPEVRQIKHGACPLCGM